MVRIPFHLCRTAKMAFDKCARGNSAEESRSCIEERFAWNELLRLTDIGHDWLFRLLSARRRACQSKGRAHQTQEPPARSRAVPIRRPIWELVFCECPEIGSLC